MAACQAAKKAARDVAILRRLHDIGLRRGELVDLDLADVDLARSSLMMRGKGRTQTTSITLPAPTQAVLQVWIAERGNFPGPLFTNFDRARKGDR